VNRMRRSLMGFNRSLCGGSDKGWGRSLSDLPEYQGRGLGYEASVAILDYAVPEFAFEKLDAITQESNVASIALLKKLGFEHEGMVDVPDSVEVDIRSRMALDEAWTLAAQCDAAIVWSTRTHSVNHLSKQLVRGI